MDKRSVDQLAMKKIKKACKFPENEVAILQKIDHPNVVRIVDSFSTESASYVVFEKAECQLNRRLGTIPGQTRAENGG